MTKKAIEISFSFVYNVLIVVIAHHIGIHPQFVWKAAPSRKEFIYHVHSQFYS